MEMMVMIMEMMEVEMEMMSNDNGDDRGDGCGGILLDGYSQCRNFPAVCPPPNTLA